MERFFRRLAVLGLFAASWAVAADDRLPVRGEQRPAGQELPNPWSTVSEQAFTRAGGLELFSGLDSNGMSRAGSQDRSETKADERKHIQDNAFFVEEAYNQEEGVVQHVFNWLGLWTHLNGRRRDFNFNYTMELPLGSVKHQFSFTPMVMQSFIDEPVGGPREQQGGIGDFFVNYRYQLLSEEKGSPRPSVAPRFSLLLPIGDESRGLGVGELGYQFNLPISKELTNFTVHFNAGCTYIPGVSVPLESGFNSPGTSLRSYNLGASAFWLASYDLNFFVELAAFWNEDLDELGSRVRSTEIILNPGLRYAVYTSDEAQWVLGIGVPIGLSKDAPDYGIFGYMSVEHAFKKLNNGNNGPK